MPERGPAQFLLLSLPVLARSGWRIGLAAILVALLSPLPREESVLHQAKLAKAEFSASLRQAAWKHVTAGESARPTWPWDAAPAAYSKVPRLGLSATVEQEASGGDATTPPEFEAPPHMTAEGRQDPHLQPDDLDTDDAGLTEEDPLLGLQVLGCPAAGPEAGPSDPHLPCPHADLSLGDALRLIIQSGKLDKLESQATTSDEQKL